jgi:hypothetical protein
MPGTCTPQRGLTQALGPAKQASRHMEALTHTFQSLSFLIEALSLVIAAAGLFIAFQGYKAAGAMISIGSGFHALGYFLLMRRDLQAEPTPLNALVISAMYPGLLLLTVGICYLAYSLRRKRGGA